MKKLIGAMALTAALTASAFAEVTFGAWLCTLPTLFGSNGDKTYAAGIANPWNYGARTARIDIGWTSDDGKAGMTMGVYDDAAGGVGQADNTLFWIKPIDQVKLSFGKHDGGGHFAGLRGDMVYGSWNWLRPTSTIIGEGYSFSGVGDTGLGLVITPIDGLTLFASLPMTVGKMDQEAEDAFKNIKVGAGYKIADVGTIKFQFLGNHSKTEAKAAVAEAWVDKNGNTVSFDAEKFATGKIKYQAEAAAVKASEKTGAIEAAFDLTGIDKLYATAGVKIQLADSDFWKSSEASETPQVRIPVGVSYGITDTFKVSANVETLIYSSDSKVDPKFNIGAGIDFAATDALSLVADFRFLTPTKVDGTKVDDTEAFSFLVGATYACGSNASLGIGFQGMTHGAFARSGDKATDPSIISTNKNDLAWTVPLRASIWF